MPPHTSIYSNIVYPTQHRYPPGHPGQSHTIKLPWSFCTAVGTAKVISLTADWAETDLLMTGLAVI